MQAVYSSRPFHALETQDGYESVLEYKQVLTAFKF